MSGSNLKNISVLGTCLYFRYNSTRGPTKVAKTKVSSRFFAHAGHETTYASNMKNPFFTKNILRLSEIMSSLLKAIKIPIF